MKKSLYFPAACVFIFLALAAYWFPTLHAGYMLEDSWFLEYRILSVFDLLKWFFDPRDFLGYYRPIRKIFFAIPTLFMPIPPPELYHAIVLGLFFLFLTFAALFYHSIFSNRWAALLTAAGLGLSACFIKPLSWISASHNIFAALFCTMALYFRLNKKRGWSLFCFFLAMCSRESSTGLLLALCWIEYVGGAKPPGLREFFRRTWDIFLLAALFVIVFLWEAPPVQAFTSSKLLVFPLWLERWMAYLLLFLMPSRDSFDFTVNTFPFFSRAFALLFSLFFLYGFSLQAFRRDPAAIFGWIFIGGLGVHLVYADQWHQEYATMASLGFYGFCAFWILKAMPKLKLIRRWALVFCLIFYFIFVSRENRAQLAYWNLPWKATNEWISSLLKFQSKLGKNEILVIRDTQTFNSENGLAHHGVFLPQYLRLAYPDKIIYWDSANLPWVKGAYGVGYRTIEFDATRAFLEGKTLVHAREENGIWHIMYRDKNPVLSN